MNCEQAQTILIDSTIDPSSMPWIEATDHISDCKECMVQAQFERQLGAWLAMPFQPDTDIWNRIETQSSNPALRLWMNPTNQKEKMKRNIITSSVAAATIMVGLSLISQTAMATTPRAKFVAMKKAVLATVVKGDRAWLVRDGKLVEALGQKASGKPDSVPGYILESNGVKPAVPGTKVEKTLGVKAGIASGSGPVGEENAKGLTLQLDLNEAHYSSIRFGKDQNELVLTQKGKSEMRYVVKLDKKTSAPTYLSLQKSEKGSWQLVQGRQVTFTVYLPLN